MDTIVQSELIELEELQALPAEQRRAYLARLAESYTDKDLAQAWGVGVQQVRMLRRELGIRKGARGKLSNGTALHAEKLAKKRFNYEVKGVGTAEDFTKDIEEIQNLLAAIQENEIQYEITVRS